MVADRIAWKVSVAGDRGTGKSSLISRIVYDSDGTGSPSKLLSKKRITVESNGVKIPADLLLQEISDEPEAERFLPGSNIILVLVDVTRGDTLGFARQIVRFSKTFEKKPAVILVGTKADLKYEAEIWTEDFDAVKKKDDVEYYIVSAKTGTGIQELLSSITATLFERFYARKQRTP